MARKECIEHKGTVCSICGMNFEKVYGKIGKGFIHIHHIKPLSEVSEEYIVDPINNLIPVCLCFIGNLMGKKLILMN